MLPPEIVHKIEEKFGRSVRYSSDVVDLTNDIVRNTNKNIGLNTVKRFMGIIKCSCKPRLYTLDIISVYLGYKNWDELTGLVSDGTDLDFANIEKINSALLEKGDIVSFTYDPCREVDLQCLGDSRFVVMKCFSTKLHVGDEMTVTHFTLNYPVVMSGLVYDGKPLSKLVVGRASGITTLKLTKTE